MRWEEWGLTEALDHFFVHVLPRGYAVDDRKQRAKLEEELNAMSLICEPRESSNAPNSSTLSVPGVSGTASRQPSAAGGGGPNPESTPAVPAFPGAFVTPAKGRRQRRRTRDLSAIMDDTAAECGAEAELAAAASSPPTRLRAATLSLSETASIGSGSEAGSRPISRNSDASSCGGSGTALRRATMADPQRRPVPKPPRVAVMDDDDQQATVLVAARAGGGAATGEVRHGSPLAHVTASTSEASSLPPPPPPAPAGGSTSNAESDGTLAAGSNGITRTPSPSAGTSSTLSSGLITSGGNFRRTSIHLRRQQGQKPEGRVESAV